MLNEKSLTSRKKKETTARRGIGWQSTLNTAFTTTNGLISASRKPPSWTMRLLGSGWHTATKIIKNTNKRLFI